MTTTSTPTASTRRRLLALLALADMIREDVDATRHGEALTPVSETTVDIVNDALRVSQDDAIREGLRRDIVEAARRFLISPGDYNARVNLEGVLADTCATLRRMAS